MLFDCAKAFCHFVSVFLSLYKSFCHWAYFWPSENLSLRVPQMFFLISRSFLPDRKIPAKPTFEELQQKKEEELKSKQEREEEARRRKEEMAKAKADEMKQKREAKQKKVQEARYLGV